MSQFLDTFAELNAAFGQEDGVVVLPIDQVVEDPLCGAREYAEQGGYLADEPEN